MFWSKYHYHYQYHCHYYYIYKGSWKFLFIIRCIFEMLILFYKWEPYKGITFFRKGNL
jgi:hypothetical protein